MSAVIPTGRTQVKLDKNRRTRSYWVHWQGAEDKHRRRLGPARVKDSGRRTPRRAVIWRAGDGPPTHLTSREAEAQLAEALAETPRHLSGATVERIVLRDAVEGRARQAGGVEQSVAVAGSAAQLGPCVILCEQTLAGGEGDLLRPGNSPVTGELFGRVQPVRSRARCWGSGSVTRCGSSS